MLGIAPARGNELANGLPDRSRAAAPVHRSRRTIGHQHAVPASSSAWTLRCYFTQTEAFFAQVVSRYLCWNARPVSSSAAASCVALYLETPAQ